MGTNRAEPPAAADAFSAVFPDPERSNGTSALDHMTVFMDEQFIPLAGLAPAALCKIYERGVRPSVCGLPVYLYGAPGWCGGASSGSS